MSAFSLQSTGCLRLVNPAGEEEEAQLEGNGAFAIKQEGAAGATVGLGATQTLNMSITAGPDFAGTVDLQAATDASFNALVANDPPAVKTIFLTVNPPAVTLRPGEKKNFTVTVETDHRAPDYSGVLLVQGVERGSARRAAVSSPPLKIVPEVLIPITRVNPGVDGSPENWQLFPAFVKYRAHSGTPLKITYRNDDPGTGVPSQHLVHVRNELNGAITNVSVAGLAIMTHQGTDGTANTPAPAAGVPLNPGEGLVASRTYVQTVSSVAENATVNNYCHQHETRALVLPGVALPDNTATTQPLVNGVNNMAAPVVRQHMFNVRPENLGVSFHQVYHGIIRPRCLPCHSSVTGPAQGGGIVFETLDQVRAQAAVILSEITSGAMPLAIAAFPPGPLKPQEVRQFKEWVDSGMPLGFPANVPILPPPPPAAAARVAR